VNRDVDNLGGRDPHDVVGVVPGADRAEINRKFRQRLRQTHPDAGGDHDEQVRLNLARDILLDPARLREYEQQVRGPAESRPEPEPDDSFEWTSGAGPSPTGAGRPPPRPAPYEPREFYSQPPASYTNPVASLALYLSFCVPFAGIILGSVALYQIWRGRGLGRVRAGVAIAISTVAVLSYWFPGLAPGG
jgi:curved DNA-binding protein CbpA